MEDVFALGHDYGQDYDLSSSGKLADDYRLFNDTKSGKSKQHVNIENTYAEDSIAQQIIETPVFDALSNWRNITNPVLAELDKNLDISESFKYGLEQSRLKGMTFVYPVLKYADTRRPVKPSIALSQVINTGRPLEVSNIVVLTNKLDHSSEIDEDICSENYGNPIMYSCNSEDIHHSRLVVIGNEKSFFNSISGYLADFHDSGKRLHMAARRNNAFAIKADFAEVQRFIQSKAKVGVNDGGQTELEKIAMIKARTLAVNLNDNNVAVIGQNESIVNFQAQNIDDLVKAYEQQMYLLSGVADIPASRLFALIQSGMGNSGFQDVENYSQSLDTLRSKMVDKGLRKLDGILAQVNNFEYDRDSWTWNDTKAEEMLLRLRGISAEAEET